MLHAGMAVKSLLKYDRVFLIKCARRVDARFLQPNWAKLCSQFKDVCLSPQVCAHVCMCHCGRSLCAVVKFSVFGTVVPGA